MLLVVAALICGALVGTAPPKEKASGGIPAAVVPAGLGVNIHFVEPARRDLDMIAAAGFRFVRMDFSWAQIERQKGEYDFSAYERLVDALAERGLRPLFILDYGNPLYDNNLAPYTDEGRQAFARFAAAGAAKLKGRGVVWELWNEPNVAFWSPRPNVEDYMALAKVVLPAVRGADPGATIVAPAAALFDLGFVERCFERGLLDLVDAVSIHPYGRVPPETVAGDYHRLRVLIDRYAPKGKESLPIVSGEWGYSGTWFSREQQGQFLARTLLANSMAGVPLSIWYDWRDDGPDPKEPEHNYGTLTADFQPKPAYVAAQTLIQELRGFRFVKRLSLPSDQDYAVLFAHGAAQKVALWTTGEPHSVTLPVEARSTTLVRMTGEQRAARTANGTLAVELTGSPQYLGVDDESRALRVEAAWRVESKPSFSAGVPASHARAPRLTVVVTNPLNEPVSGSVEAEIPEGFTGDWVGGPRFRLEPRETARLVWEGSFPRREELGFRVPVTLKVDQRPAPMRQDVLWAVANPLQVKVAPRAEGVRLEVENPSGEPFEGVARLDLTPDSTTRGAGSELPVRLASGERRKTVAASAGSAPVRAQSAARGKRARLAVAGSLVAKGERQAALPVPAVTFQALEWFGAPARGEAYQAVPDGDARVPATVGLRVTDAPGADRPFPYAARVDFDFGEGWRFLRVTPKEPLPIAGRPKAVGMWVYNAGRTGDLLRCRFVDATGKTLQPLFGEPLAWQGWRWMTMPLDDANVEHWGGAGDSQIHYPIRWDTLALIDSSSHAHKGTVYFAGLTLLYEGETPHGK